MEKNFLHHSLPGVTFVIPIQWHEPGSRSRGGMVHSHECGLHALTWTEICRRLQTTHALCTHHPHGTRSQKVTSCRMKDRTRTS